MEPSSPKVPNQLLVRARQARGWSQADVASKLKTTTQVVNKWERGAHFPGPHYRQALCALYEKTPEELGLIPVQLSHESARSSPLLPEQEKASAHAEVSEPPRLEGSDTSEQQTNQFSPEQQITQEASDVAKSHAEQEGTQQENNATAPHTKPISSPGTQPAELAPLDALPYAPSPFFTAREAFLEEMHSLLATGREIPWPLAIVGLGGIGKTQVVLQYAYRHRGEYQAIWWVKADAREALAAAFADIARQLGLPVYNGMNQYQLITAVKRWLQEHAGWLLIFDNVVDLRMLQEFIPMAGLGHIVLTTRVQALGTIARPLELQEMQPEEGALLLLRRAHMIPPDDSLADASQTDREAALDISQSLGGLPLALDQAGAYIEETACGVPGYRQRYGTQHPKLLKRRSHLNTEYPASVATTWLFSFRQVERTHPAAAELLSLCAFLDPDSIPEEMIASGAPYLGSCLGPVAADPLQLDAAIDILRRFSLLRRNPADTTLRIHRLVQDVLKDRMPRRTQKRWALCTIHVVNSAFSPEIFDTAPHQQRYIPHTRACLSLIEHFGFKHYAGAHLLMQAGWYLQERGFYDEAEPFCLKALPLYERGAGINSPAMTDALTNVAVLYEHLGKYEAAELHYRLALAIHESAAEQDERAVANSLNNLAHICGVQGKYQEALALAWRALGLRERTLGPEHPEVARSLDTLAVLYNEQGDHLLAGPLYQRALAIRESLQEPDQQSLALSLHNLAIHYAFQGDLAQAEAYSRQALSLWEQLLGPEHPTIATVLTALAEIQAGLERDTEAETLNQRAISILEHRLGPEHPDLAPTLNNLASLYNKQGKYTQAESLYQRALSIVEKGLGAEHIKTALVLYHYAILLRKMGRADEADRLVERAQAIETKQGRKVPFINNMSMTWAD